MLDLPSSRLGPDERGRVYALSGVRPVVVAPFEAVLVRLELDRANATVEVTTRLSRG
jgi:hypothetical protein